MDLIDLVAVIIIEVVALILGFLLRTVPLRGLSSADCGDGKLLQLLLSSSLLLLSLTDTRRCLRWRRCPSVGLLSPRELELWRRLAAFFAAA